jgi:hypothetical protein
MNRLAVPGVVEAPISSSGGTRRLVVNLRIIRMAYVPARLQTMTASRLPLGLSKAAA